MTSPAASPQKPAITNSTASPARVPSVQPTPTHNSQQQQQQQQPAVAMAAAAAAAVQSVQGKWQCALRDNPVIASGTMAWTRVWRFSKLLLQTGC